MDLGMTMGVTQHQRIQGFSAEQLLLDSTQWKSANPDDPFDRKRLSIFMDGRVYTDDDAGTPDRLAALLTQAAEAIGHNAPEVKAERAHGTGIVANNGRYIHYTITTDSATLRQARETIKKTQAAER